MWYDPGIEPRDLLIVWVDGLTNDSVYNLRMRHNKNVSVCNAFILG